MNFEGRLVTKMNYGLDRFNSTKYAMYAMIDLISSMHKVVVSYWFVSQSWEPKVHAK